jgi:hypothetical protein
MLPPKVVISGSVFDEGSIKTYMPVTSFPEIEGEVVRRQTRIGRFMIRTFEPRKARRPSVLPSPSSELRLRIRLANGTKRTIKVAGAKCTIGSQKDCTIRIPVEGEVGVHCIVLRSRGKIVVRNWGNKATVNGRPFEIAQLKAGDFLRISGCTIRVLRDRKKQRRSSEAALIDAQFGKRLVGEIGKRLAHLEDRLVARQKRLSRQLQSTKIKPAKDEPKSQAVAPIAPVVVEGLTTLRSAVEELRAQVEQIAERPWQLPETQAIDVEGLISAASAKMGDVVQSSLREDRTQRALKFEQIGRDFDRIGDRLGEVEQKLNLRVDGLVAEQVRPISQAVEFVRSGLQAMEDRQALDARRFEKLTSGLDSFRQSTIERLGAMSDKMRTIPSLAKVEESLSMVSAKVEGLSQEIAQRQERYFTREDAASLLEQLDAASSARNKHEERFAEIGGHFIALKGEWTEFQAGTRDQLEAIAAKIDSLPLSSAALASAPIDLGPMESAIATCEARLNECGAELNVQGKIREQLESRIDAAVSSIEAIREDIASFDYGSRIDQLANEMTSTRDTVTDVVEQSRGVQNDVLNQLVALESRCEYLESELARLSRMGVSTPIAPSVDASRIQIETAQSHIAEAEIDAAITSPANAYYASPYDREAPAALEPSSTALEHSELEYDEESEPISPKLSETSRFDALTRSAIQSQLETETRESAEIGPPEPSGALAGDEDAAPMPNSVVESLRRSGIWKDGHSQEDVPSESNDDPRDIVGSSFQSDSTPPTGLDPGKHPSDQLSNNTWSPQHPRHHENEDESIDAYMERLLQRVSGGGGEVTGAMAVAEHFQKAKAQAAKKKEARPENEEGEFEYTPRVSAPEKSSDLSALRELAMTSANANIQNYHAATKAKSANEKWVVVVVAILCAIGLLYICVNYQSNWTFLAAGAAFVVALYWAILASCTNAAAKKMLPKDPNATSQPNAKRRKSDQPSAKSMLEQASAGETFQALMAERERERDEPSESAAPTRSEASDGEF